MPVKELRLLGAVRAGEIQFLPDFRYQLLAYLAYQADWVRRDELASLFWSETDNETARHNLRQLLSRLKQLKWCDLEIEKDRARWRVESDAAQFKQTPDALDSYRGAFLQGLESGEANNFQTWLLTERELLHTRWRDVLMTLVKTSEPEKALLYLGKILRQDPLDEEAVQISLSLYAVTKQPLQAAAVYKTFAKTLEAELGLTPTSRTEQFFKETTTPLTPLLAPSLASSKLPNLTTNLIGRETERLALADALSKQRLVTLTGPGGIGKTRLSKQVALDVREQFTDGVYFVPLESLTHASEVPGRIAETLHVQVQDDTKTMAEISHSLQAKKTLLILDNLEHLLEARVFITELLMNCAGLVIMVTSREKLNFEPEKVFVVEPLSLPQASDDLEVALAAPSAQLFIERARRVSLEFTVSHQDLPYLVEVCKTLGGIPLALELAAVWVRVMPLADLSRELLKNLDLLESSSSNRTERHRSIRAAFDHSWKLLNVKEQETLVKLSVFRSGFSKEATSVITQSHPALLFSLVDKSLVQLGPHGRYDFHPLFQTLLTDQLKASASHQANYTQAKEAHRKYFIYFMERVYNDIRGGDQATAFQKLREDIDNCLLAWREASSAGLIEDLLKARPIMTMFFDELGRYREGDLVFSETLLHLQSEDRSAQTLKTYLLADRAWFCYMLGDFETSLELGHQGLSVARSIGDSYGMSKSLNVLACIETDTGQLEQAALHYQESLDIARREQNHHHITVALLNSAGLQADLGNYTEAEAMYSEALTLSEQSKDTVTGVGVMNALGKIYFDMERLQEAIDIHQKSVDLCGQIGLETSELYGLRYLAEDYQAVGRRSEALICVQKGLELARKTGIRAEQERLENLFEKLS